MPDTESQLSQNPPIFPWGAISNSDPNLNPNSAQRALNLDSNLNVGLPSFCVMKEGDDHELKNGENAFVLTLGHSDFKFCLEKYTLSLIYV